MTAAGELLVELGKILDTLEILESAHIDSGDELHAIAVLVAELRARLMQQINAGH